MNKITYYIYRGPIHNCGQNPCYHFIYPEGSIHPKAKLTTPKPIEKEQSE